MERSRSPGRPSPVLAPAPCGWGDPEDRARAVGLLRQAVHQQGISHIDTADAYGPHTVEELAEEALHRYPAPSTSSA
ncbi:aldo/keto reductase [Streptomyces cyaneofuscatus]|uniref:aldo/keto reductase n=1 Tax=Streptomyces cyaneofuscatus TaxID=66883 RepID=UPI0037B98E4E